MILLPLIMSITIMKMLISFPLFYSPFSSKTFSQMDNTNTNTNIHNPYDSFSSYSNFYKRAHNTDWTDIVLQPYPYTTHYTQGMSFIIRELLPDQQYEAKVIARLLSILINICFVFRCFHHKKS